MKELLEKLLRFDDLFLFLTPGFLLTCSLLFWIKVNPLNPFWKFILTKELILVILLIIGSSLFSYILQGLFWRIPRQDWKISPRNSGNLKLDNFVLPEERLSARRLSLFDSKEERKTTLFDLAENSHKRFIFSYRVSLALLTVGLQAILRLVIIVIERASTVSNLSAALPSIGSTTLLAISILTLLGYTQQRRRAIKEWMLETYITEQLLRQYKGIKP